MTVGQLEAWLEAGQGEEGGGVEGSGAGTGAGAGRWVVAGPRLCGRSLPRPLSAPPGLARLVFRSDQAVQGDGFTAQWELGCGGNITAARCAAD